MRERKGERVECERVECESGMRERNEIEWTERVGLERGVKEWGEREE